MNMGWRKQEADFQVGKVRGSLGHPDHVHTVHLVSGLEGAV